MELVSIVSVGAQRKDSVMAEESRTHDIRLADLFSRFANIYRLSMVRERDDRPVTEARSLCCDSSDRSDVDRVERIVTFRPSTQWRGRESNKTGPRNARDRADDVTITGSEFFLSFFVYFCYFGSATAKKGATVHISRRCERIEIGQGKNTTNQESAGGKRPPGQNEVKSKNKTKIPLSCTSLTASSFSFSPLSPFLTLQAL